MIGVNNRDESSQFAQMWIDDMIFVDKSVNKEEVDKLFQPYSNGKLTSHFPCCGVSTSTLFAATLPLLGGNES